MPKILQLKNANGIAKSVYNGVSCRILKFHSGLEYFLKFHLYVGLLCRLGMAFSSLYVIMMGLWSEPRVSTVSHLNSLRRDEWMMLRSGVESLPVDLFVLVYDPSLRVSTGFSLVKTDHVT